MRLILLSFLGGCLALPAGKIHSIACDPSLSCRIIGGKHDDYPVHGSYLDDVDTDGWGKLWVETVDDSERSWYGAGYLEGALTSRRIYQHFTSWYNYQFGSGAPTNATITFIEEQYAYALSLASSNVDDPYYHQLHLVLRQFQGLVAGSQAHAAPGEALSLLDFLLLEAAGDLYDIIPATNPSMRLLDPKTLSYQEFNDMWHNLVSCSALIKVTPDDVFAGHTTWTSYQNMLRIYKHYSIGSLVSSFSSKPGVIFSKDDFYTNHKTKLVVMETTNGVINQNLYDYVTPASLLTWQRIPLANALAASGQQWTDLFAKHNSGTYCNQYMILDMKKYTPGKDPSSGFMWIQEVIPGMTQQSDVTQVLQQQGFYWPSYNIPYHRDIYVISGFKEAYETYGDAYSYLNASRAQIFRRDQGTIKTFSDMQHELRLNQYQTDPLSENNPTLAISSRKDLLTSGASPSGGIDTKVTSYTKMQSGVATSAQSGPTYDDQAVFSWSDNTDWDDNKVHLGQPDTFNFPFVDMVNNYAT